MRDEAHRNSLINDQLREWRGQNLREANIAIVGFPGESAKECERCFKEYEDKLFKRQLSKANNLCDNFRVVTFGVSLYSRKGSNLRLLEGPMIQKKCKILRFASSVVYISQLYSSEFIKDGKACAAQQMQATKLFEKFVTFCCGSQVKNIFIIFENAMKFRDEMENEEKTFYNSVKAYHGGPPTFSAELAVKRLQYYYVQSFRKALNNSPKASKENAPKLSFKFLDGAFKEAYDLKEPNIVTTIVDSTQEAEAKFHKIGKTWSPESEIHASQRSNGMFSLGGTELFWSFFLLVLVLLFTLDSFGLLTKVDEL
eukprot:g3012.t1